MKIGLNVPERLRIMNDLLPPEGNIATLRMIRKMIEKIGLSAEEMTEFEVVAGTVPSTVQWNEKGNLPVEIELVDAEAEVIRKELRAREAKGTLKPDMVSIYEKFIPE